MIVRARRSILQNGLGAATPLLSRERQEWAYSVEKLGLFWMLSADSLSTRQAGLSLHSGLGQRHRAHLECNAEMAGGSTGRMALHRAGKTNAEWLRGKFQWPPQGRVPEREPLCQSAPCPPFNCNMARRPQPSPPPLEHRRDHPEGVSPTVKRGPNLEQG